MNTSRIFGLLCEVAVVGAYGTRPEWITLFDHTQATNAPGMLFSDAVRLKLLVDEVPGYFILIGQERGENE